MTAATSSVGTVALAPELGSGDNVSGDLAGLLQIRLHAGGDPTRAGGRPAEPRTDLKQRSLLVRFGRRGIEQLWRRPPSTPIVTIRLARSIGREAQQPHPSVGHAANITN